MKPMPRFAGKVGALNRFLRSLRGDETWVEYQRKLREAEAESLRQQITEAHQREPNPRPMLNDVELQVALLDLAERHAIYLCSQERAMHVASMAALIVGPDMVVHVEEGASYWAVTLHRKAETRT